jgi:hypothetical protein
MISFIVGKAAEDYNELLDKLKRTPLVVPNLNDDSFTNWKANHPVHETRKVYNNGILELVSE